MTSQQGLTLQILFCLLFAAYVAVLNVFSAFTPPRKNVKYSAFTIISIILISCLLTDWFECYLPLDHLWNSISALLMAVITVTIVFIKERTMKTIGLATEGIIKSLIIGLVAGLAECLFWGNLNLMGELPVTAIETGEIVFIAPLFEEVFFRGFLYRYFRLKKYSVFKCVVLTSLIWTIIHFYSFNMSAVIFISGLLLGYIRVKTKSIVAPIIMHCVWNFFVL